MGLQRKYSTQEDAKYDSKSLIVDIIQKTLPMWEYSGRKYMHASDKERIFLLARILILVFLCFKVTNFRGIIVDCWLAAPISTDFIRGISAGKLDSFRLEWRTRIRHQWLPLAVAVSLRMDEKGYLYASLKHLKKLHED